MQERPEPELDQGNHCDYDDKCDLCRAEKVTEWLYEDSRCWIAYCDTCYVPMMVFKAHREPNKEEFDYMVGIAKRLYPQADLRFWRGRIPDHFHFHCDIW